MRKCTVIFLLLGLLYQTFSKSLLVVDYLINRDAYAKNCVNKAIPKMHCNGRCQMMKKMHQEESKDQQNPERKSEIKDGVLSSRSFFAELASCRFYYLPKIRNTFRSRGFGINPKSDIFHPPQTLA